MAPSSFRSGAARGVSVPLALVALVVGAAACGPAERPPPAGDSLGAALSPVDYEPIEGGAPQVCEPGEQRACRHYFRDSTGQLHCPISVETCLPDGLAWSDCGELPDEDAGAAAEAPDAAGSELDGAVRAPE